MTCLDDNCEFVYERVGVCNGRSGLIVLRATTCMHREREREVPVHFGEYRFAIVVIQGGNA